MTDNDIICTLRNTLVPRGEIPTIKLFLKDCSYFHADFVKQCINEVEKIPVMSVLGEQISPLQLLAIQVLKDSAYIER